MIVSWSRLRVALGVGVASAAGGGGGGASGPTPPAPPINPITPTSEKQVTNIDVLRQQLRNYYGDPLNTGVFAADSYYAKEAGRVARRGSRYLAKARPSGPGAKAVLLAVDDTTLNTWNYEVFSNFAYNPTTNADFVLGQKFPAVPGMVSLVQKAKAQGYAVFYLTGRGAAQEAATLGNLTSDGVGVDAGYPAPTTLTRPDGSTEDGLFTKPAVADYPQYLKDACSADPNGSCTTVHYKTATRAHLESLGFDLVANFGDQYSDLTGGYADRAFKLPNPTYFLP